MKDAYVINLVQTLNINQLSVELCICHVQTLKVAMLEELKGMVVTV